MLIVMQQSADADSIGAVVHYLQNKGLRAEALPGGQRTAIGVLGNKAFVDEQAVARMDGVKEIIHVTKPYKLVSREFYPVDTLVQVGGARFGAGHRSMIAGPCGVESEEQILTAARNLKDLGVQVLRGGAFKPRTSPYSYQGLGHEALGYLAKAREETGLAICVEIIRTDDVQLYDDMVDLIQVGARNMQNYELLKRLGKIRTPVLLKRGPSATVDEFLLAAEYLLAGGNKQVILCERGIRTFERSTRYTLDLNSVALIKQVSHLPIIVDPSHAAGRHDLVGPLAKAGLAVGADGLIVETHPKPTEARSDASQQLDPQEFAELYHSLAFTQAVPA